MIILLAIGLDGCIEQNNQNKNSELDRFVGTWKDGQTTFIFFSDGICSYLYGAKATYDIKDSNLVIDVEGGAIQTFNYQFLDNDTTLILTNVVLDISFVLTKQ